MRQHSEAEWKKRLTPEQYHVLRAKGTEPPFTGSLLHNRKAGLYTCAACGNVVFKSNAKYDTKTPGLTGWPSFAEVSDSNTVDLKEDTSLGMRRTEVICKACGLGHLFDDPDSPTGKHYCINSNALKFKPNEI